MNDKWRSFRFGLSCFIIVVNILLAIIDINIGYDQGAGFALVMVALGCFGMVTAFKRREPNHVDRWAAGYGVIRNIWEGDDSLRERVKRAARESSVHEG